MVKIQDGSTLMAGELIGGSVEDAEGNKLKFEQKEDALTQVPRYEAVSKIESDDKNERVYTFDLTNTLVRVSMSTRPTAAAQAEQQRLEEKKTNTNPDLDYASTDKDKIRAASTTTESTPSTTKAYKTV